MEKSVLKKIQDTVIKYADVISSVINVEVEIVDNDLYRIAGTGIYKDRINENISKQGYIYKHVLNTGKEQIVENPGECQLCSECKQKNCCVEKMQICKPIKLSGEIIGVIGLICASEEQKSLLLKNEKFYLQFLSQISEFISSKAYEYFANERNEMMINLLKQIIDSMDKGVLVTNIDNEIVHMNSTAMKQLKLTQTLENISIEINPTCEYVMKEEVYVVNIDNRKINLVGKLIPVFPLLPSCDKIFIFDEIKKAKAATYEENSNWKTIELDDITGNSQVMLKLKEKIKKIASSKSTVLITGESGTGKELMARAIHCESNRKNKPFIAINCGAIPDSLLESELFGYVRGAFSGADPNGRIGKFELANKGTVFLDEIGDMPLFLQVKILRVLQERKIVRIGSNQLINLDIRVIAATNKDLKKLVEEGKFREDLYYRLNVIPIEIPSLRERKEDIELISMSMIEKYNRLFNKHIHTIEDETKEMLINYSWLGNVRELENTIEFMINMDDDTGVLGKDTLPRNILEYYEDRENKNLCSRTIMSLKEIETEHILRTLDYYGYDTKGKQLAAKQLGIGIATLYRKLENLELSK